VTKAAKNTIPYVFTLFYAFRIMLLCGGLMFLVIVSGLYFCWRRTVEKTRWWLWVALLSIPLPYIASESGWIIAEIGRQPWTVHGFLPTFLSSSSISVATVAFSLGGFVIFYSALFVVEMFLMFKYGRLGPSSLGEGRYHFEKIENQTSQQGEQK